MLYKKIIRPILFLFHPDYVHVVIVQIGKQLGKFKLIQNILSYFFVYTNPILETKVCGIAFKNPIGLAGGFDKNAQLIQTIPCVGFGFMEVGSVTYHSYAGNKRPWNVRLPKDKSLIVNYGLKNKGAKMLSLCIQKQKRLCPVIINIAKTNNANIKGDASIADYISSFRLLQNVADMININISCPNAGDGILFCEDMDLLKKLLDALQSEKPIKPLFLKLKPDISDDILEKIIALAQEYLCVSGFIISNLSRNRNLLTHTDTKKIEQYSGGISGMPIKDISTAMIRKVYMLTNGAYPIIGVGGVFSALDAYEKIRAGALLVELMTGMIYEGPSLVKNINKELVHLLKKDGFTSITQAVGADCH
jgi:dihydroorotate dehydrogenase subfamily 2